MLLFMRLRWMNAVDLSRDGVREIGEDGHGDFAQCLPVLHVDVLAGSMRCILTNTIDLNNSIKFIYPIGNEKRRVPLQKRGVCLRAECG
jgi:hypothetical protein